MALSTHAAQMKARMDDLWNTKGIRFTIVAEGELPFLVIEDYIAGTDDYDELAVLKVYYRGFQSGLSGSAGPQGNALEVHIPYEKIVAVLTATDTPLFEREEEDDDDDSGGGGSG